VVRCEGEVVALTTSEVKLLAVLAKTPGHVRQRAELLAATGDSDRYADERTVDAHVKNVRRKLGACGEMLETVRGMGYRLRV
jgi:DNA-binding response OmpR family regulator